MRLGQAPSSAFDSRRARSHSSLTNRCDDTDDGDATPTDVASVTLEDLRTAVSVNTDTPYPRP